MNFENTCFKTGFKNCILKIRDVYLNSKFVVNRNLSQDSINSVDFLWYITSQKKFLPKCSNFKNPAEVTKEGKF